MLPAVRPWKFTLGVPRIGFPFGAGASPNQHQNIGILSALMIGYTLIASQLFIFAARRILKGIADNFNNEADQQDKYRKSYFVILTVDTPPSPPEARSDA